METVKITVGRKEARELYRQYKTHSHYSEPIDHEIQRTYQLIAQGRVIIRALESIKAAGLNEAGLPKLAITRASAAECWLDMWTDGRAWFSENRWQKTKNTREYINFPAGSFPERQGHVSHQRAIVPIIPIHLRPKRGLENYHILWEAEWERVPPVDPYLLRRIGKADLWLVVAAWDLTEVERAAMAARI